MPKTSTPISGKPALRFAEWVLLGIAAVFLALHFIHLKADFPNNTEWRDWAKYTDEGWYGDAAIRHYQLGHWNVPGDFNPGAALPVLPLLEGLLFQVTGVSLAAARALSVTFFALALAGCYAWMRLWCGPASLAPAATAALLAISPFCFAFSRLAILEPLLVLWAIAALLVATQAGRATARRPLVVWTLLLGLLFPLMVLTKTTAVFLFPAVLWMLWAATGYRILAALKVAAPAAIGGLLVWGAYLKFLVKPKYLIDYQYLFSANAYTGFTWKTLGSVVSDAVFDGVWIGKTLFAMAAVSIIGVLVGMFAKGVRANPLQSTMLVWVLGYGAFLAYHANLQPRYYLVLAVPLTALVALVFEPLLAAAAQTFGASEDPSVTTPSKPVDTLLLRITAGLAAGALAFAAVYGAWVTLLFVRRPDYTWVSAAAQIRAAIDRERALQLAHGLPAQSRLVLSISGSDLSLMTGLPSICDDFGSMTLSDRIAKYRPGWFATWNEVEDDKMEALAPMYRLVRVTAVPAFDDTDRNLIILYRLDALAQPQPGPVRPTGRRRTVFVPKSFRSRIGEQPTVQQLTH
jgi:hypothetical protein